MTLPSSTLLHFPPLRAVRPLNVIARGDHPERIPGWYPAQRNRTRERRVTDKSIVALELDLIVGLCDREGLTGCALRWPRFTPVGAGEIRQLFVGASGS